MLAQTKKESFEEQFNLCKESLSRYCYSLTKHKQNAEDLLFLGALKAYAKFEGFRNEAKFRSWMFSIIYKAFIDEFKKKVASRPLTISFEELIRDEDCTIDQKEFCSEDPSPLDILLSEERKERLLSRFNEEERHAIIMRAEGFTNKEATTASNIREGALKHKLSKARRKAARLL